MGIWDEEEGLKLPMEREVGKEGLIGRLERKNRGER